MADNLPGFFSETQDKNLIAYSKKPAFFKKFYSGIIVVLVVLSFLILILNFFRVFNLSKLSPFFEFLPRQQKNIDKVDDLIYLTKNPDPELLKRYNVIEGVLGGNTERLIKGSKGRPPRIQPVRGLDDLRRALEEKNNVEAKLIIRDIVERSILATSLEPSISRADMISLSPKELQQINQDNNFLQLRSKNPLNGKVSIIRKNLLIELIMLYKLLE